ncbi:phosphotransferase-like protein [Bradyrhizobium niftali]|uniref:phosphotransferase-like protein n=1 Tax=Bradyrhizobium niftali TaxID=2560055 RepID=UPI00384D3F2C
MSSSLTFTSPSSTGFTPRCSSITASSPIIAWQREVHVPGIYDVGVDTSAMSPQECSDRISNALRGEVARSLAILRRRGISPECPPPDTALRLPTTIPRQHQVMDLSMENCP